MNGPVGVVGVGGAGSAANSAVEAFEAADSTQVFAVPGGELLCMKVRRPMVPIEHPDADTEEPADLRHAAPMPVVLGIAPRPSCP
jgi:hypothetical protein